MLILRPHQSPKDTVDSQHILLCQDLCQQHFNSMAWHDHVTQEPLPLKENHAVSVESGGLDALATLLSVLIGHVMSFSNEDVFLEE
jgi:hypothetical protein